MTALVIGAVAAHFGRDVGRAIPKIEGIIRDAREAGVHLLVLPDATLGGYLSDLQDPELDDPPPAVRIDGPELAAIRELAGDMVVCIGIAEPVLDGSLPPDGPIPVETARYNTAVCLSAERVWGVHRKVHRPLNESRIYAAGDRFAAFDTPIGRIGMLIDYDKTFPEAARALADDGAQLIACLSAWPASTTDRAAKLVQDRQARLFDLYDVARAAENQVVLVSANQTGVMGRLRFLGAAKIVGPGGDVLARTGPKGSLAVATVDVAAEVTRARRRLHHLNERVPAAYAPHENGR